MTFQPPKAGLPRNVCVGDTITFEFIAAGRRTDVTQIGPIATPRKGAAK
jgi:hypothetical protein